MGNTPNATLDRTFTALSDPTRRAIVSRLLAGDATVMELAEPFEMSLPAVSKHIAILAKAGLVTQSKRGRERWCRLDIDCLSEAVRWMESFGQVAGEDWEMLEKFIEETGSGNSMQPIQPATREYRTWTEDSRRWAHYRPRKSDIVIATYPKCGTTWMQRIVGLLVFQTTEPINLFTTSVWIDRRFGNPIAEDAAIIDAQTHRRFLKSHLPFDGLPIFNEVKYIHVARDGRDAALSWHNHVMGFTDEMTVKLDKIGLEDDELARAYPKTLSDPADEFHRWLNEGFAPDHDDGLPNVSYFQFEKSWWKERHRENVLLVHFNDLRKDLAAEMARIAGFLDIDVPDDLMPQLISTAGFAAMRRDGAKLMPTSETTFKGGHKRFLNKGSNRRWEGVFRNEDVILYEEKLAQNLPADGVLWLTNGRSG